MNKNRNNKVNLENKMKPIVLIFFFWAGIASAHEMRPAYLGIRQQVGEQL